MPSPVLAMVSPISMIILLIVLGVAVFTVWKVRSSFAAAAAGARERERALMVQMAPVLMSDVVVGVTSSLDDLVLPDGPAKVTPGGPLPTPGPLAVRAGVPSVMVIQAVAELRAGAQRILDAAASGGDAAAADVMIAVATGPAVTALALRASED